MNETTTGAADAPTAPSDTVRFLPRWFALLQTIAVCSIPTQVFVTLVLLVATDLGAGDGSLTLLDRVMTLEFLAVMQLIDTALIALLIRVFLELSNESSRDVFIGAVKPRKEILYGLLWIPVVFIGVNAVVLGIRALIPALHTVKTNPLGAFLDSPLDAAIFLFVVALGGGIREELQRAFILHRFEQRLGGVKVGLVLFSLMFAALHAYESIDVAIGVGVLGVFWGVMYIKRKSAVLSMTNHAVFNALQVFLGALARSYGGN